jgi:hypothetical protein
VIQNDLSKGLSDDYDVPGLTLDLVKGAAGEPGEDEDEDEDEAKEA